MHLLLHELIQRGRDCTRVVNHLCKLGILRGAIIGGHEQHTLVLENREMLLVEFLAFGVLCTRLLDQLLQETMHLAVHCD